MATAHAAHEIIRSPADQRPEQQLKLRGPSALNFELFEATQNGDEEFGKGNRVEAFRHYQRVLDKDPKFYDALSGICNLLWSHAVQKDFVSVLEILSNLPPQVLSGNLISQVREMCDRIDLTRVLDFVHRTIPDGELSCAAVAAKLYPEDKMIAFRHGVTLLRGGDVDNADLVFLGISDFPIPLALKSCGLGFVKIMRSDISGAEVHFDKALSLNPDCESAHLGLARCALLLGEPKKAIAELGGINYHRISVGSVLAAAYAQNNQPDEAYRILDIHPLLRYSPSAIKLFKFVANEIGCGNSFEAKANLYFGQLNRRPGQAEAITQDLRSIGDLAAITREIALTIS